MNELFHHLPVTENASLLICEIDDIVAYEQFSIILNIFIIYNIYN